MTDTTAAWDHFIHWAKKFYEQPNYYDERQLKLEIASAMALVKDAIEQGDAAWQSLLTEAFRKTQNIQFRHSGGTFRHWARENSDRATQALKALWDEERSELDRFNAFGGLVERPQVSVASMIHSALGVIRYPFLTTKAANKAYKRTKFNENPPPIPEGGWPIGDQYAFFLSFVDRFVEEAGIRGWTIHDRLEAQSLIWATSKKNAHLDLDEGDRDAFLQFMEPDQVSQPGRDSSPAVARQDILDAMDKFDTDLRDTVEWTGWEEWRNFKYALVYEGKRYPVKQIYSTATGKALSEFVSTQARAHITAQGFAVVPLRPELERTPNVWWVSQGDNYTMERDGGYIWAPKQSKRGGQLLYWESLKDVVPGDIILHYSKTALRAGGIANSTAQDAPNPKGPSDDRFGESGRKVDVSYHELAEPIPLSQIPNEWRVAQSGSPFNVTGGVNQGYLYPIPAELLQRLIQQYPDRWPEEIVEQATALPPLPLPPIVVEPPFADIIGSVQAAKFRIEERRLRQYHLALKTRGFVILAGPSGTGKTWLTKVYADAVGARHEIVAVAPNWTTNEDLLGFHNPMTGHFHDTAFTRFLDAAALAWDTATAAGMTAQPYHLVLDEMNLARVEYYFAEFLSRMELRARGEEAIIPLGPDRSTRLTPNLRVIGTVNIDETTHGFADKVYDRAQLLVLDVTREEVETHLAGKEYADHLLRIWEITAPYKPFAFRVLDEIGAYIDEAKAIGLDWPAALDDQVLHKILPKLNGHDPALGTVLAEVVIFLQESYPLSHAHASRMLQDYTASGLASYFH